MSDAQTTFADLARRKFELFVICQKCGHRQTTDGQAPGLHDRPIAGQRFRCSAEHDGVVCGGIGLPTMRPRPDWIPPPKPQPGWLPWPPQPAPPRSTGMTQSIDTRSPGFVAPPPQAKRRRKNWAKNKG